MKLGIAGAMVVGGRWTQVGGVAPAQVGTRTLWIGENGEKCWLIPGELYPTSGVLLDIYEIDGKVKDEPETELGQIMKKVEEHIAGMPDEPHNFAQEHADAEEREDLDLVRRTAKQYPDMVPGTENGLRRPGVEIEPSEHESILPPGRHRK